MNIKRNKSECTHKEIYLLKIYEYKGQHFFKEST